MYLIGMDFGTTNLKAILYTDNGSILRYASRPTPTHYTAQGFAEYHPDELFELIMSVLAELVEGFSGRDEIMAVSFASMAESGVALDRDMRPLAPSIAWFDRRTIGVAEEILQEHDPFFFFRTSGMQLSHVPSLCKIVWERKNLPDIHNKTYRWVFLCNYLAFKLTGECCTDPSQAGRSMVYDIHRGAWSEEICSLFDIDPAIFPSVMEAGRVMGNLLPKISRQLGLNGNVRMVMGGHDHPCGALSTGLRTEGILINSSGTVDAALSLLDPSRIDRPLFERGFACGRFLLPGTFYTLGGIQAAGKSVEWFAENFYRQTVDSSDNWYAMMNEEVEKTPAGSDGALFIPHLRGSIVPHKIPYARGAFLGLKETHLRGQIARAIYEGLAMEYRLIIEQMEAAIGEKFHEIRCFGGGSRNSTWLRIKADVLGRPLTVYSSREHGCLGAVVLAGIGGGVYRSMKEAVQAIQSPTSVIEPDLRVSGWYNAVFHHVYKPLFDHLNNIDNLIDLHWKHAKPLDLASDFC